ncbi:MAG: hypothetical protein HOP18_01005, partial [Deltaproteobacteria bacterium]|nr:hypothetical protein [Deltaproteobacteria bacterium]
FVDPLGRPFHLSTADEGVIIGQVFPQQQQTVYTRFGDWFVVLGARGR